LTEARLSIPRPRIESLSDLIFGLALSIGAIELVSSASEGSSLTNGEVELAVAAFGFNFLILIGVWNRYTSITSVIPVQTSLMARMNMLLLFLVAIEPYFFNLVVTQTTYVSSPLAQSVSAYYGVDIGSMNLVLAYFTHLLAAEGGKVVSKDLAHQYKVSRNILFGVSLLFLVSAIPIFWTIQIQGLSLRIVLWLVSAFLGRIARFVEGSRGRSKTDARQ
jgi:uncharacterized membrane protein